MALFRFPFVWGPAAAPSVATTPAVTVAPVWTALGATAATWQLVRAAPIPRFEHIYQQDADQKWVKVESP